MALGDLGKSKDDRAKALASAQARGDQDSCSHRSTAFVAAGHSKTYQLTLCHSGNQDACTLNSAGLYAGLRFVDTAHTSRVHRPNTQHLLLT